IVPRRDSNVDSIAGISFDANQDGYSDLVVGAPDSGHWWPNTGKLLYGVGIVVRYLGGPLGLDTKADAQLPGEMVEVDANRIGYDFFYGRRISASPARYYWWSEGREYTGLLVSSSYRVGELNPQFKRDGDVMHGSASESSIAWTSANRVGDVTGDGAEDFV